MPTGRYTVLGDDGAPSGTEDFRCAPGPMGWRYFSDIRTDHHEIVDIAVDRDWRIARLRIDTGEHDILLEPRGDTLTGYRDRREIEIPYGPQMHLDYFTPGHERDHLPPPHRDHRDRGGLPRARHPRADGGPPTLRAPRPRAASTTPVGTFEATRWTFTSLDSGWTADLWIAGDTVVRYDRLFTLEEYEPGASGVPPIA